MINEIIDSFNNLIKTIGQNKLASILALVSVFLLYNGFTYGEKLSKLDHVIPSPEVEKVRFINSLKANDQIQKAVNDFKSDMEANRVVVRQFHNGKADLSGIPFNFVSTTFTSQDEDYKLAPNYYESKPLSTINNTVKDMWHEVDNPQCIVKNTTEIKDDLLKVALEERNVTYTIFCPMTNLLKYPVGYISVNFVFQEEPTPEDIEETKALSQKIVGFLSDIKESESEAKSFYNLWGLLT